MWWRFGLFFWGGCGSQRLPGLCVFGFFFPERESWPAGLIASFFWILLLLLWTLIDFFGGVPVSLCIAPFSTPFVGPIGRRTASLFQLLGRKERKRDSSPGPLDPKLKKKGVPGFFVDLRTPKSSGSAACREELRRKLWPLSEWGPHPQHLSRTESAFWGDVRARLPRLGSVSLLLLLLRRPPRP